MCCHSVILPISLSVGFLDSLHDPSAHVAPHDIPDVAIPVYKHPLTPPPGFFLSPVCRVSTVWQDTAFSPLPSDSIGQSRAWRSIQGPESVADSLLGNQVPATEIPQDVAVCFLWRTHLSGVTLKACRYERRLAEANANRNTHFMGRHF